MALLEAREIVKQYRNRRVVDGVSLQVQNGNVVGLLGPLMILVMGGLVLVIVLAMLLPIFELNQLVK